MTDDLRDDIAYLRALAEEGRQGPLLGGSILMAGGLIFGTASLIVWAALDRGVSPDSGVHLAWFVAMALFFAALFLLKRRITYSGGASKTFGQAWGGLGWGCCAIVTSLLIMGVRAHDPLMGVAIAPVILGLYGAGWSVAALATNSRGLMAVALGAFGMALVLAWFAVDATLVYLIYALSLYLLAALPGFVLMRQARRAA